MGSLKVMGAVLPAVAAHCNIFLPAPPPPTFLGAVVGVKFVVALKSVIVPLSYITEKTSVEIPSNVSRITGKSPLCCRMMNLSALGLLKS